MVIKKRSSLWYEPLLLIGIIAVIVMASVSVLGQFFAEDKSHLAFADSFEKLPLRVQHSPTVCAIEPQLDQNFPGVGKKLLDEALNSVLDWNAKMNQGLGKHPVWNITFIKVLLGQQNSFDYSKCDITIHFLPKTLIKGMEFAISGITIPNLETGKTNIEIYYADVQPNWQEKDWVEHGRIYYTYVNEPYYTGNLATTTQIDSTIRHEFGHALGLGHYLVPDDELKKIVDGMEDMPSIMIPMDTALGITHFDITPLDISEIKSIYGDNGFDNQLPSNQAFKRVHILGTDKSSYQTSDMMKLSIDTSQFSNDTSGEIFLIDSDNHQKDGFSISKSSSKVYLSDMSDKNGKYWIEFLDPGDKIYDVTEFTVSNNTNVPSFNQPIQSQLTKPLSPFKEIANNTSETSRGTSKQTNLNSSSTQDTRIPSWVKKNAGWWAGGSVGDSDFVKGMKYLISNEIMKIPPTTSSPNSNSSQGIPSWVKKNAGWWADGSLGDGDFIKGMQYLVTSGIIKLS